MAILGYDAVRLVADAIKRAGSTDGPKVRDALAATKGFGGAAGELTMDADRNALRPVVVVQVKGRGFHYAAAVRPKGAPADAGAGGGGEKGADGG